MIRPGLHSGKTRFNACLPGENAKQLVTSPALQNSHPGSPPTSATGSPYACMQAIGNFRLGHLHAQGAVVSYRRPDAMPHRPLLPDVSWLR